MSVEKILASRPSYPSFFSKSEAEGGCGVIGVASSEKIKGTNSLEQFSKVKCQRVQVHRKFLDGCINIQRNEQKTKTRELLLTLLHSADELRDDLGYSSR